MRTELLTSRVKALSLKPSALMPSAEKQVEEAKKKTRESIKSWQRLQRLHIVRNAS